MRKKRVGWVLVALGAALFAVSALAEPIGLGAGDGIGWKQTVGMIVGAIVLVAGVVLNRKRGDAGPAPAEI